MTIIGYAAPLFVFAFLIWFVLWMDRRFERKVREAEEQRARADHLARISAIVIQEAFNEGADASFRKAQMGDWEFTNLELWKKSQAKMDVERL